MAVEVGEDLRMVWSWSVRCLNVRSFFLGV